MQRNPSETHVSSHPSFEFKLEAVSVTCQAAMLDLFMHGSQRNVPQVDSALYACQAAMLDLFSSWILYFIFNW